MDPYCVYPEVFFLNCSSVLSYCILSICVVLFAEAHSLRAQNNLSQTTIQMRCCVFSEDLHLY